MLSRRTLLAASGAICGSVAGARPAWAADVDGTQLTLEPAELQIAPGRRAADAVRLAGTDPAPSLGQNAPVNLRVRNALAEAVSLRWDGLRGWGALDDPGMQGLAGIPPGQSRTLPMRPANGGTTLLRAAPSPAHLAARGLQGVLVVEEPAPPAVDRDVALLVADRLFTADGSPRFGSTPPADVTLSIVTVNGRPAPLEMEATPRARLRLRLVNGSVRRFMLIGCEGARLSIMAVDGQPSEMFMPARNTVPVGPGARYDLMFDMPEQAGAEVRLTLKPTERLGTVLEAERLLVRLRAAGAPLAARPPVAPLPPNRALPTTIPLEAAKRADLVIAATPRGPTVNGAAGSAVPVLTVRRGDAVALGLVNTTTALAPLRIAGHAVRLLHARDDGWDPYWRDTLLLPPGGRSHVAFVADAPGRWAIDSGYDDLTLAGLSCCFVVTPG